MQRKMFFAVESTIYSSGYSSNSHPDFILKKSHQKIIRFPNPFKTQNRTLDVMEIL
jgi:hypothetical protein